MHNGCDPEAHAAESGPRNLVITDQRGDGVPATSQY